MTTNQTIEVIQEEIVTCEDCPKADVCTIIRSIAAQYEANKVLVDKVKTEFGVEMTMTLNASVIKCPHKPGIALL